MGEYLSFRKFITPAVIQVIFWIGVVGIGIYVLIAIFAGGAMLGGGGGGFVAAFLLSIVGGVVVLFLWRIYCELIMLWFKIHDELVSISKNTAK
jgi:Domain of unknown function (DUF4282)